MLETLPYLNLQPDTGEKKEPEIGIHWYTRRKDAFSMWYGLPEELDTKDYARYLMRYSMLPAIVDNFETDKIRHNWLSAQTKGLQGLYEFNRLRVNHISTVIMGIPEIAKNLESESPSVAKEISRIGEEVWEKFKSENRSRISLEFSDYLVEKSMSVLEMLGKRV